MEKKKSPLTKFKTTLIFPYEHVYSMCVIQLFKPTKQKPSTPVGGTIHICISTVKK